MTKADPKSRTNYDNTDWNKYKQGRPPYPQSFTELVYDYHRRHPSAGWERLVDIGAGSGIAATNFMADFKIIHNSDPSPWNEQQAREFLSTYAKEHGLTPELEFSQSIGEEAYKHVGESAADLVIVATAAHFMDPDGLVECAAKILRPGGTLAVYSYWLPSFPDRSQHFNEVFHKTFDNLVLKALEGGDDASRARFLTVAGRRMTGAGCLDSLPLPAGLFQETKRIYINSGNGDIPYKDLYQRLAAPGTKLGGVSRVSENDEILRYITDENAEAEGWAFDASKEWFPIFFNSMRAATGQLTQEEARDAYQEWEQIFDEECRNGTVRVYWPFYVALARKK
jgi:SAM-dependent methyltransferase